MDAPKKTPGRKKLEIDDRLVVALCSVLPNTIESIADYLNVPEKTFRTKYGDAIKRGRALGRKQLSNWQWKKAKDNTSMQIFLGKNYLDQTEKVDIKSKGPMKHTVQLKYSLPNKKTKEEDSPSE